MDVVVQINQDFYLSTLEIKFSDQAFEFYFVKNGTEDTVGQMPTQDDINPFLVFFTCFVPKINLWFMTLKPRQAKVYTWKNLDLETKAKRGL